MRMSESTPQKAEKMEVYNLCAIQEKMFYIVNNYSFHYRTYGKIHNKVILDKKLDVGSGHAFWNIEKGNQRIQKWPFNWMWNFLNEFAGK